LRLRIASREAGLLDVLVGLSYGGSRRQASIRVGGSGDGGGIQDDRLGVDIIYRSRNKGWNGSRE
jgi:restriction system protein